MRRNLAGALGAGVLALAIVVVPMAMAAETTREEYVAGVEPICKQNTEANSRIFKGAKGEVESGELVKGSKHFARAATAFTKTITKMEAVPQPTADESKLSQWFGYLRTERDYIAKIGKALAAGNKGKAQNFSVRLNRNSNLANNKVLGFGFDYCLIDSSRFS